MTKTEVVRLLGRIKAAWSRDEMSPETAAVYAEQLIDLDGQTANAAVSSLMRASRWRPTIAEVRERVAEMTLNLPIASDAWHEVEEKARQYDDYDEAKKWPSWSHPLIKQTVRDLGGLRAIYYSNNPSTDRAHFLRLYKEQREAAVLAVQDGLPAAQVVPIDPGQTRALPTGTTDQES